MLSSVIKQNIIERIKDVHNNDEKQLEVIFSDANKLIVEAPAGCGKTKTIISKIAYIIASNELPNPKKILALTFSVNAAYKMKKDVSEELPKMIDVDKVQPLKVNDKVYISNYHGFARHILNLYGYLIHENLRNINFFDSVDDSDMEKIYQLGIGLSLEQSREISDFNQAVKEINIDYIKSNFSRYIEIINETFIPNNMIPYNAILILAIELFNKFSNVKKFYQGYFPVIIVDEFQDTNILSWNLLKSLISEKTNVIFMGDSLQRIYGFIGAIPNLMASAENYYKMVKIELNKNYRFKDNAEMLILDKNIRSNAEDIIHPNIEENARINLAVTKNQQDEAKWVTEKIMDLIKKDPEHKIAILVKQRSINVEIIIAELEKQNIDYFFGLFRDDDSEYINFHRLCLQKFNEHLKSDEGNRISKSILNRIYNKVEEEFEGKQSATTESLLSLLKVFFDKVIIEYSFLDVEDKISFIKDTFENNVLKQHMENISKNVVLSTIHGAKGLEWSYVIMPDMEQFVFPNYYGLCGSCKYSYREIYNMGCILNEPKSIEDKFLEELSVFYVGVTRARKQIFFSSSQERVNYNYEIKKTYISCLLSLPGIEYNI